MTYRQEELLICTVARLLEGIGHIAVGVSSPIPGSAALLMRALSDGRTRVSMLNSRRQYFTDGATEIFDMAAQGRLGAFFLGGGQIDGQANVNLVGVGDYPRHEVRWSGSFGSAFLYFMVPRVILFRQEHTTRVLVPKVDFVSAPGTSPPEVHRPGGPHALVTGRCLFSFDRQQGCFRLESVHPGQSVEDVVQNTGFEFDLPDEVPTTPEPEPERLALIRDQVARDVADAYPQFAAEVFGVEAAA
jgi:glutaconate CoA-transferase subunit B